MSKYLIFFFLLSSFASLSQNVTVNGVCRDRYGKGIEGVFISCENCLKADSISKKDGRFQLLAKYQDSIKLVFRFSDESIFKQYLISNSKVQNLEEIKFSSSVLEGVNVPIEKSTPFEIPTLAPFDNQRLVVPNVEHALAYTTAAVSNNELTSNYNVRGGNYDENLVYVNGFLINRPFLTRSGQQEGLSFLYSSLVKDLRFSAGGFDVQYGDKLSSVLDVTYKTPTKFRGSMMASLMGVESHVENNLNGRFTYLAGVRYRNNGYLLNSLPAKGAYNPIFMDAQFLTNYLINEKLTWSLIGHFSSNNYRFAPQTSQTDFGLSNEAYRFNIYFDGQENTLFQTLTAGTALKYELSPKTKLDFYGTIFRTDEREYYDIQGQYYLNALETDPSKQNFGDSIANLGVGTFLDHARNRLNSMIYSVYHNGEHKLFKGYKNNERTRFQSHIIKWGAFFEYDNFKDSLSEWKLLDSAGYSIPYTNSGPLTLNYAIKSSLQLENTKSTGFLQMNSIFSKVERFKVITVEKTSKFKSGKGEKVKVKEVFIDTLSETSSRITLDYGVRFGYSSINEEFYCTPRFALTYSPKVYMVENGRVVRRNVKYRLSSGLYYQPPFYREFRTVQGVLNLDVKSQKSAHFVLGTDYYFNMWERKSPFKFTAEAYYKYMWDVNPYYINNVRTIYFARNNAKAYAYGLDLNVNGQFIEGIESFFKIGLLSTKEDHQDDYYYKYFNKNGEQITPWVEDKKVIDSSIVHPGYIPRPSDQLFNFGALIQDKMPNYENITVQVGIQFATGLPFGTPNSKRYQDTLRQKSYFRVDIGTSYHLFKKDKDKFVKIKKVVDDAMISLEVFNLLGINNILSNQWVQTTDGLYYPVPNYLTQRRFNLKLVVKF